MAQRRRRPHLRLRHAQSLLHRPLHPFRPSPRHPRSQTRSGDHGGRRLYAHHLSARLPGRELLVAPGHGHPSHGDRTRAGARLLARPARASHCGARGEDHDRAVGSDRRAFHRLEFLGRSHLVDCADVRHQMVPPVAEHGRTYRPSPRCPTPSATPAPCVGQRRFGGWCGTCRTIPPITAFPGCRSTPCRPCIGKSKPGWTTRSSPEDIWRRNAISSPT